MNKTLTISQAFAVGDLVTWVTAKKKVRFSRDGGATILTGTLRHIVRSPDNYGFLGHGEDIRDGYVRITLDTGLDIAVPVPELMEMVSETLIIPAD